jgi:ABC-type transport system substrate-binding protein
LGWQQASNLAESNPELQQAKLFFISSNGMAVRVDMEPFSDIRVRKAMQMAIDRDTISQTYYGGIVDGTPCGGINPINVGWCKPYAEWPKELQDEYGYHPDRSMELLTEAGYPGGFSFTLLCDSQVDLPVVEIVKSYLADIGIEMGIQVEDPAAAMAMTRNLDYEAVWGRNTGSTAQPSTIARMDYSTSSTGFNRVSDPDFDAKCEQLVASTDMEEVKRLSVELDYYAIEHHWGIRLFPINIFSVWYPELKGYSGENMLRMGSPGGWPWARYWLAPE